MGFKRNDFSECVGSVNVILDDRIVLQGQIVKEERHHDDPINVNVELENQNEFITLILNCEALIIRDNAELKIISPTLFDEGDRIRINVSQIVAIGPSHGCPDDDATA
ncbi:hypothetical protein [Pelosinus sp. sgz500959]|uniref:hypothetical protein n=1 Tax=Pelosinus sp. sgz500959 TaxID=3242472 RepID=UPI00366ED4EC